MILDKVKKYYKKFFYSWEDNEVKNKIVAQHEPWYPNTTNNGYTIKGTDYTKLHLALNHGRDICYGSADAAGWYVKPVDNGTRFMLMVSEIAEAMEADRKNKMDDHLIHRHGVGVELADCIIRILDFCGKNNINIGACVAEKIHYNQTREDHKLENRMKEGGKKY